MKHAAWKFPYRYPAPQGVVETALSSIGSVFRVVGSAIDHYGAMIQGSAALQEKGARERLQCCLIGDHRIHVPLSSMVLCPPCCRSAAQSCVGPHTARDGCSAQARASRQSARSEQVAPCQHHCHASQRGGRVHRPFRERDGGCPDRWVMCSFEPLPLVP